MGDCPWGDCPGERNSSPPPPPDSTQVSTPPPPNNSGHSTQTTREWGHPDIHSSGMEPTDIATHGCQSFHSRVGWQSTSNQRDSQWDAPAVVQSVGWQKSSKTHCCGSRPIRWLWSAATSCHKSVHSRMSQTLFDVSGTEFHSLAGLSGGTEFVPKLGVPPSLPPCLPQFGGTVRGNGIRPPPPGKEFHSLTGLSGGTEFAPPGLSGGTEFAPPGLSGGRECPEFAPPLVDMIFPPSQLVDKSQPPLTNRPPCPHDEFPSHTNA